MRSSPRRRPSVREPGLAYHHAGGGDSGPGGGMRKGPAADPGRPRRLARLRSRHGAVDQVGNQRTDGGTAHVCRAASPPAAHRCCRPNFPCRVPTARAPWRRTRLSAHGPWHRAPRGSRPVLPRRGHAGAELRTDPSSPATPGRRRRRRNARTRPDRRRRLAQRARSRGQAPGRGAHRRPGGQALRKSRRRGTRRAHRRARAPRRLLVAAQDQ